MNQQNSAQNRPQQANNKYMPAEELSMFCEQVSLILSSGVSLYDGMEALADNYKNTSAYTAFERIQQSVVNTGSLYEALKGELMFPPYLIEMVQIGEHTGKLDSVMADLSLYYMRQSKIRRSIQNAVVYPLGLLSMMAIVILVLVWKVLPIFEQVYKNLGAEMPDSASVIMRFGTGVGNVVLILSALLIVCVLIVVALLRTRHRQRILRAVTKVFAPVRRIQACMTAEKFASNLGMMLDSGYPLEEAMPLIANVFDDAFARAKIDVCAEDMKNGKTFPEAIAESGIFDKLHNKMIQMGFMAGKTDRVMDKLAVMYEDELDHDISRAVALIEPSMVALLSVIVGSILLSVMLPMVSVMSSIL